MKKNLSITIAIPAYNEENNITEAIESALRVAAKETEDYEILVVNDGSTDSTGEILSSLAQKHPKIRVITHLVNQGIEPSLKDLYANSSKEVTFFNGADNEIKMSILPEMVNKLNEGYDIVVAKRRVKRYNLFRSITSWGFNFFVKTLFGLDPYDAGCAKLFKSQVYKNIKAESTSVFGEAERLIRAHKNGYKISFVPVTHFPKSGPTSINISHVFRAVKDLITLYFRI